MTQDITHTPISTLSERIKKTPKNNSKRGFWTGPRGESTYIPIDCQIEINHLLKQFGIIGITYIYGFPDFETCSIATVKILDMEFDEELTYTIVGSTEVDLSQNKISNESPIGKALIGAKKNQIVEAQAPAGVIKYKILSITK